MGRKQAVLVAAEQSGAHRLDMGELGEVGGSDCALGIDCCCLAVGDPLIR